MFGNDRLIKKMVDSRGFEPLTPRVQGEYSTSLNYKPNDCLNNYESLIVVFWNICNTFICCKN